MAQDSTANMATEAEQHSLINTKFPVLLPEIRELHLGADAFDAHVQSLLPVSTKIPIRAKAEPLPEKDTTADTVDVEKSAFITGLLADKANHPSLDSRDGKMLTENVDVAYRTSGQALVDLFYELEDVVGNKRLKQILEKAWDDDAEATLKITWNSRSIHLGKSSRTTFYRAVGWLAQEHPRTLIVNLPWLVRPLIQKKVQKKEESKTGGEAEMVDAKDAESDFEIIDDEAEADKKEELEGQPERKKIRFEEDQKLAEFDIKYGVSHGYWKDLLNILALAVNDQLKVDGDVRSVLNVKTIEKPCKRDWTYDRKKTITAVRHERAVEKLINDKFYQALHLTIARLFAQQLATDIARLQSGHKADMKVISLAAKWAPTHKGMHDQHTCIVSTIAELLHPFESACPDKVDVGDRELYLKYARIAYQSQTLSPLRKHLNIVERDITDEKFENIKYERVPSLAMKQYTPLFAKKDYEHFDQYIEKVASGKKTISGATLLPSTLVHAVKPAFGYGAVPRGPNEMVDAKLREIQHRTIDAQWNTLVQRIKDSGTVESSIAVCDVSGSMSYPVFPDGTCPMSSSIGLALLLAEVTKPPFGGAMITFSDEPEVFQVGGADDKRSFEDKVKFISEANWGGSTDFVAVFEKLILPMAIENKLTQEDMVKQIFVFSDMQFNSATPGGADRWTTSYERIQKKFKQAGYEVPQLIFWNLAGGRAGFQHGFQKGSEEELTEYEQMLADQEKKGRGITVAAPKPVTAAEKGTALVSGYSQAMLKMFLENGSFEEPDEEGEEVVEEREGEDGEVVLEKKVKEKKKLEPLAVVKKAIGHDAYRMLKVVD